MSDDNDMNDIINVADSDEQVGKRKIGFLPAVVITILKWFAIALCLIIFIVTVVLISIRVMGRTSYKSDFYFEKDRVQNVMPEMQWYEIGSSEIRCRTMDKDKNVIVLLKVSVGFPKKAKELHQDLIEKTPKLRDEIRMFFGGKTLKDLAPENEKRIKEELKIILNSHLISRKYNIEDVIFGDLNIIEY